MVCGMGWDGMGWDGMGWDGMGWYLTFIVIHTVHESIELSAICTPPPILKFFSGAWVLVGNDR